MISIPSHVWNKQHTYWGGGYAPKSSVLQAEHPLSSPTFQIFLRQDLVPSWPTPLWVVSAGLCSLPRGTAPGVLPLECSVLGFIHFPSSVLLLIWCRLYSVLSWPQHSLAPHTIHSHSTRQHTQSCLYSPPGFSYHRRFTLKSRC